MTETIAAPANKPVTFGADKGKAYREPAGAAKMSAVRRKAKSLLKRGLVSEKAVKRHLGDL